MGQAAMGATRIPIYISVCIFLVKAAKIGSWTSALKCLVFCIQGVGVYPSYLRAKVELD